MALLLIAALYGLMFFIIKFCLLLEMNDEARLIFNIIGGIGALLMPLVIYSFVDSKLTQRAVNIVGQNWCYQNDMEFSQVKMQKNHFTLIYKVAGKNERKKFRVYFILSTWFVKSVEWLPN